MYFRDIINRLLAIIEPLIHQFPYVFITMKLMGIVSIVYSIEDLIQEIGKGEALIILVQRISLVFLFAYIGALIICIAKSHYLKLIIKITFYFVVLILYATTFFLTTNFAFEIDNPTLITLIAETTSSESDEFIKQYILSSNIIPTLKKIVAYLLAIVCVELLWSKYRNKLERLRITKTILTIITIPLLLFGLYSIGIYYRIYNCDTAEEIDLIKSPKDPISSVFVSWRKFTMMSECMENYILLNQNIYDQVTSCSVSSDSLNLVVVIGESHIKWHSPLYGYYLNTSPNLIREKERGRLFKFNDVITSSNSTSIIMKNILCCNNSSSGEQWYNYPNFLTIFKKAGYDVYFWDNQKDFAKKESYSYTLNNFLYNSEILKISYTAVNDSSFQYDEDIVDSYINTVGTLKGKQNIVVFHLMGQHTMPSERYPNEFGNFTEDSITNSLPFINNMMKSTIAHYDNASLYNDYVINRIISLFKNSNTLLVYFSDHGEEIYDYREKIGRSFGDLNSNILKFQYDVPFVIWCSDIFIKKYPEKINQIKSAVDYPFMIDNVCNMLFNVAGITTPFYRDSLDLISPNYRCNERIINQKYKYEFIRNSLEN